MLLISIDTLRADHLGCYAPAAKRLSPNIDRLAAESVLFEEVSATVPVTLPSLTSLFTSRYPGEHPVRTNRGRLPPGIPALAEVLQGAGYTTAAYYGNALLRPESGLGRGFAGYTSFVPLGGPADERGAEMAAGWLAWDNPEPWFLWVHFMDPHGPYDSAPPSWSEGLDDDPLPDTALPVAAGNYGLGVLPRYQQLPGLDRAGEYRRRYRGEVRFTDAQVGRLLAALEDSTLAARTLVVLTSDHGESLGEHDLYFQHGWFPYENTVRVPLLVRLPGGAGTPRRVAEPVSLVDVMPTLLAGLGIAPPAGMEGRDLRAAVVGARLDPAAVFAVTGYLNQMSSIRLGDWKLVHTPKPPMDLPEADPWAPYYPTEESWALYELDADPGETRSVSGEEQGRLETLRHRLLDWERAHGIPLRIGAEEEVEIDAATKERLEALGYGS